MFNKKIIALIVLSCCFFENTGKNIDHRKIEQNLGKPVFDFVKTVEEKRGRWVSGLLEAIERNLGKPVSSFVLRNNFYISEQFIYTSKLSGILLTSASPAVQSKLRWPVINGIIAEIIGLKGLAGSLFDNRFENFIKNVGKFSQRQLREAIEDAILLSPYNSQAYSARKLLNHLVKSLQEKVADIKDQIKHDSKWDQKSFRSMKKSVAWVVGLAAIRVIAHKYTSIEKTNVSSVKTKVSNLEALDAFASLGLLPASYLALKNGYKTLTIDPQASTQYLDEYEELLAFVQKLKDQLETDGFITLQLATGRIAIFQG